MKNTFLSVFLISTALAFGQTHTIDEENHTKVLFHIRKSKDADSINFYINKLKQSENQCRVLFATLFEANTHYYKSDYDTCTEILETILHVIKTNPRPSTFVYSEHMIGKTYAECINIIKINVYRRFFFLKRNEKKLEEAYNYLLLMQNIVDDLPRKETYYLKNKISVTFSRASLKKTLGDFDESIKILKQLEQKIDSINLDKDDVLYDDFLQKKLNVNLEISSNYKRLGFENPNKLDKKEAYKFYDSAEIYYEHADKVSQRIDSTSINFKSIYYQRKSELNYYKENYQTSIDLANKAFSFYDKDDFKRGLFSLKALSFSRLKQSDSAIHYASKIISNKNDKIKRGYSELYNILAESYFSLSEIDSAYKYSQLAIETIKSDNLDKEKASINLKKEELDKALLLNKTIENKKNSLTNNFILIACGFVILALIISVYSTRKRRRLKQKVEVFKKELKLLKQTNHLNQPKKEAIRTIDNETTIRILNDLSNIEASEIFLSNDFSLNVLAKLLNTNTSYLSRIINEHKQKSFKQYLIDIRIKKLIKNLEETPIMQKYSIEALGESIGYSNASSFTRIFKNYIGVSPSAYLKEKYTDIE